MTQEPAAASANPAPGHSPRRWAAWALTACSLAIGLQALQTRQPVGSALYAPVLPLYVSGILPALLTWIVFRQQPRAWLASVGVGLMCLLWALGPLAIDAMVATQGGYRGPGGPEQTPVLGLAWAFLIDLIVVGFFSCFLITPVLAIAGIWLLWRASAAQRPALLAMLLSSLALCLQVINWGGYISD